MKKCFVLLFVLFTMVGVSRLSAQTVGLFSRTSASQDGYVLFAPVRSDTTYLIDKCGRKVHQWYSNHTPGLSVFLLPDGSLLRTEALLNTTFNGNGSAGGLIARYDWNNNLIWSYTISSATEIQNHDICPLDNGNILVCIWENISAADALAAGRNPALLGTSLWSAKLVELQPVGSNGANIVWQWRLWDHLIQDYDANKPNYGVVANHPELLNLNFNGTNAATAVDWIHLNFVTYNATLNQIMFSSHNLSEIYILDRGTTTLEAASHSGGTHGKGGDFIYRWGNPQSYNRGSASDRKLYLQHNPNWIPAGYPQAGKIMIFNNGVGRPGGNAASVDIINPPVNTQGDYMLNTGQAYGPMNPDWSYMAPVPTSFFAQAMGGAQPLSNGNILICEAQKGNFFEIDTLKNTVWRYVNPADANGVIVTQGTTVSANSVYRCPSYTVGFSGFTGKNMTPGSPIELNPLPSSCSMKGTGIQEFATLRLKLYPMPASNILNIRMDDAGPDGLQIEIADMQGRIVYRDWILNGSLSLSTETWPRGIYVLHTLNDVHTQPTRFIVN